MLAKIEALSVKVAASTAAVAGARISMIAGCTGKKGCMNGEDEALTVMGRGRSSLIHTHTAQLYFVSSL